MKKLTAEDLHGFRDRLYLDIPDAALDETLPPYYQPGHGLRRDRSTCTSGAARSAAPCRARRSDAKPLALPGDQVYDVVKRGSGKQEVATTMAFVRLLKDLLKDKEIG